MNNSLVPAGGLFPSKLDRQISKALVGIEASNMVAMRRDVARIERITTTTEVGMLAVGRLGLVEATVAQSMPHVAPSLRAIQAAAAMTIAGVVFDAGRGV
jgi:hypothetical protein